MSKMNQLIELRGLAVELVDGLNAIVNEKNLNQMELELDHYAIPDENPNPQPVSFDALQKQCAQKFREGHTYAIRQIIHSYKEEELSDIDEQHYSNIWMVVDKL